MWFIYPHRESELIWYGEYVTTYFTSANAGGQTHILNLDKVICCWSGSVNNISLDWFKKFRFLEVWHVFSKVAGDQSTPGNQWGALAGQQGGGSAWQSKDPCQLFNQGRCMKQAPECWYRHIYIRCGKEGHVEKECLSKKAWVILLMSLHSVQHLFTPFYNTLYIYTLWVYDAIWPSLQIRSTLTLSNNLLPSSLPHDTTGGSHMIMCELHQSLLSWMNLRLMATHYNCFPSPCWVQYKSVVASLSDLLLYSPIVICSADPRFLSDWLVWWPWTLFSYKKHVSTFNSTEEVFPKLHL